MTTDKLKPDEGQFGVDHKMANAQMQLQCMSIPLIVIVRRVGAL